MPFYLYDGDSWSEHSDLESAKAGAEVSLKEARELARFDREWPSWTEEIRIHEGDADPEEIADVIRRHYDDKVISSMPCVFRAREVNVQRPSSELDEDGCDSDGEWWESNDAYTCDFAMVASAQQQF